MRHAGGQHGESGVSRARRDGLSHGRASQDQGRSRGHGLQPHHRQSREWVAQFGGSIAPTPKRSRRRPGFRDGLRRQRQRSARGHARRGRRVPAAWRKGAVFVDHTTASAEIARELHAEAKKARLRLHRCAGIRRPGRRRERRAHRDVRRRAEAPSRGRRRSSPPMPGPAICMGAPGSGQLAKMVNQICIAGLVQGLAEGLHFAKKAGLDIEKLIATISKGAAQSWQMENRYKTMIDGQVRFRLRGRLDAQGSRRSASPRRGATARPAGDGADRPVLCRSAEDGRQALGYVEPDRAAGALSARSPRFRLIRRIFARGRDKRRIPPLVKHAFKDFARKFGEFLTPSAGPMSLANTDPWRRRPAPESAAAKSRRLTPRRVREARDRLTSTSGTRPAFDYELLRQFAQNRLSGSLVVILLVDRDRRCMSGYLGARRPGPACGLAWCSRSSSRSWSSAAQFLTQPPSDNGDQAVAAHLHRARSPVRARLDDHPDPARPTTARAPTSSTCSPCCWSSRCRACSARACRSRCSRRPRRSRSRSRSTSLFAGTSTATCLRPWR